VRVVLLGPQRSPTVGSLVRSLPPDGLVATVTAGWQEREPDDDELSALLGTRDVNLGLYGRWLDTQDRDPEYARADRRLQELLAERQELYLLRLDHALRAVYALQHHAELSGREELGGQALGEEALGGEALTEAIEAVRELDRAHLSHVNTMRGEFFAALRPHDRPVIAAHRVAVAEMLGGSAALVIAGGHVGVLADVLHLFNVAAALDRALDAAPVIAWSAGAMALTDRIVLFGDRSARGPGHAEVYGSGLSILRDVVLLPHARARMLLDDTPRMAAFARRFAPASCVVLEAGTRIETTSEASGTGEDSGGDVTSEDGRVIRVNEGWPGGTRILGADGHVTAVAAA
jgi:hypothetical protein